MKIIGDMENKGWFQKGQDNRRGGFSKGHPNYRLADPSKVETKPCLTCNNYLTNYKSNYQKFCSKKCRHDFNKGKKITWLNGTNHWNWQGGISSLRDKEHQTSEYREWRKQVLEKDKYTCQGCGGTDELQVDHILPWAYFPELRTSLSNGRVLCFTCHKATDTFGIKATKLYKEVSYR